LSESEESCLTGREFGGSPDESFRVGRARWAGLKAEEPGLDGRAKAWDGP
jgi:hypothetical protein